MVNVLPPEPLRFIPFGKEIWEPGQAPSDLL